MPTSDFSRSNLSSPNMLFHAATAITIVTLAVSGGIWVGGISAKANTAVETSKKVEAIKVDQAVIKEQIKQIREQMKTGNKKLDDLLEAINRRNNSNAR